MKSLKSLLLGSLLAAFATSFIHAGEEIFKAANPAEAPAIKDLLANYTRIKTNVIDPLTLPGSLLIISKDGIEYWDKASGIPVNKPETKTTLLFENVIEKGGALSLNVLALVSAQMEKDDKAQVILETGYFATAPEYSDDKVYSVVNAQLARIAPNHPEAKFYYIKAVKYTTLKHKIYKKWTGKGNFSGYGVGIGGNVYSTNSLFSMEEIISVNLFPLTPKSPEPKPIKPVVIPKGINPQRLDAAPL